MDSLNSRDELARLSALHSCAVMDTPRESSFDNLVFITAQLFRAPMAALSLVDSSRVWLKAVVGPLRTEFLRASSFCNAIIQSDHVMIIEDAATDPRFAELQLVVGEPGIRFVAGAPVRGPEGHYVGALCAFDRIPRSVPATKRAQLAQLASQASELLRLRVPHLDLDLAG